MVVTPINLYMPLDHVGNTGADCQRGELGKQEKFHQLRPPYALSRSYCLHVGVFFTSSRMADIAASIALRVPL